MSDDFTDRLYSPTKWARLWARQCPVITEIMDREDNYEKPVQMGAMDTTVPLLDSKWHIILYDEWEE